MAEKIIELRHLELGYGESKVVRDLNATFSAGEMVGIVGCNGAGKSTLLKSLRGLLPLQGGEVLYYGKTLGSYSEKELARRVAYLQQELELSFDYSCLEIVLTARYPYKKWWQEENHQDKELARACLEYTGTLELADRPINELSGGQRQRVLLAKILAQQTPIIFLDEPTTGLDLVYQEEIFRFAQDLAHSGRTVLMVVHELQLAAAYCDRLLLLGENRLLADGSPQEVLTEENLERSYKKQLQVAVNEQTGSLEITARPDATERARKKQLLQKIMEM